MWEADPERPERLFIQAGWVGGYHLTFDCVAEIQGKPDSRLWSVRLVLQDGKPDASYTIGVAPSRKVVLWAPQEGARPYWCCVVDDQGCLILPEFKP
jgi:hypothetical protein